MTDDELREIVANLALSQAKTDAQLAKTDAQLAKTDAKLQKLADMYGGVGNNQGKVAEEFYYHSLKHKPEINGIKFDFIEKNVTRSKGNLEEEYDLLLVNGSELFIVEVKYRLHPCDIECLLGRKRTNFIKLFPEYQYYKIHLALASFAIEEDVKRQALNQGITLLQRRGRIIETLAA